MIPASESVGGGDPGGWSRGWRGWAASWWILTLLTSSARSAAPPDLTFSLDPASPSVGTVLVGGEILTPDDALVSGPGLRESGSSLGLRDDFFGGDFDNLDALSFGEEELGGPIWFSVDRVAVGRAGSDVEAEAKPPGAEAAGDLFRALPPRSGNIREVDEQMLGLVPGFFGDDVDVLAFGRPGRFYFSIDLFSASNDFGAGTLANDIFLDGLDQVFASGENDIGLLPGDDLDALALWDTGTIGVLDPGLDQAWFSISSFSPNAITSGGTFSPGDILGTTFQGTFVVVATAESIGLRVDDELDALAAQIPESKAPVGGVVLLLVLLPWIRRARDARRRAESGPAVSASPP